MRSGSESQPQNLENQKNFDEVEFDLANKEAQLNDANNEIAQLKLIINHYQLKKNTALKKLQEIKKNYEQHQNKLKIIELGIANEIECKLNDQTQKKNLEKNDHIGLDIGESQNSVNSQKTDEIVEIERLFTDFKLSMKKIVAEFKDGKKDERNIKRKSSSRSSSARLEVPPKKAKHEQTQPPRPNKVDSKEPSKEHRKSIRKLKPYHTSLDNSQSSSQSSSQLLAQPSFDLESLLTQMTESYPKTKKTVPPQFSPGKPKENDETGSSTEDDEYSALDFETVQPIRRYVITERPMTPPNISLVEK